MLCQMALRERSLECNEALKMEEHKVCRRVIRESAHCIP